MIIIFVDTCTSMHLWTIVLYTDGAITNMCQLLLLDAMGFAIATGMSLPWCISHVMCV